MILVVISAGLGYRDLKRWFKQIEVLLVEKMKLPWKNHFQGSSSQNQSR